MENEEEREKQRVGEGERASEILGLSEERESCFIVFKKRLFPLFLLFYYKLCHMSPFEWRKKGPLSLLI